MQVYWASSSLGAHGLDEPNGPARPIASLLHNRSIHESRSPQVDKYLDLYGSYGGKRVSDGHCSVDSVVHLACTLHALL